MKQILTAALLVVGVAATNQSFALTKADEFGGPAGPALANRTLHVTPDTRYLNVQHDEIVTLDVNGRQVTWQFDGIAGQIDLRDIVLGAPGVRIYVAPDPNRQG
jgi:propanediol utilization protein